MSNEPTVIVVEHDQWLRSWIETTLRAKGVNVCSYAESRKALDEYDPDMPGCVVVDAQLPAMSGIELYRQFMRHRGHHPFIVIGKDSDVEGAIDAMRLGAVDVIQPPLTAEVLVDRVTVAFQRDAKFRRLRKHKDDIAARIATLTAREREVMRLVVEGMLTKQIAGQLGTRPKTIDVHRSRIMKKMDVHSIAELVRLIIELEQNGSE